MERLYKKSFKRRSMERLYERLIPFGNGGDFFVLGGRALCAFGAYERRRRAICGACAANMPYCRLAIAQAQYADGVFARYSAYMTQWT